MVEFRERNSQFPMRNSPHCRFVPRKSSFVLGIPGIPAQSLEISIRRSLCVRVFHWKESRALLKEVTPTHLNCSEPHEVLHDGRPVMAVRAFLPESKQAWVLDPGPSKFPAPCAGFILPECTKHSAHFLRMKHSRDTGSALPAHGGNDDPPRSLFLSAALERFRSLLIRRRKVAEVV